MAFPVCVIDVGCPYEPMALPPCPTGLRARDVATLMRTADREVGARVLVRGRLEESSTQTLRECGDACCNTAGGAMRLDEVVTLHDDRYPKAFRCAGDDSWVCCPVEANIDVAVMGTLKSMGGSFELERPRLCALEPRSAPDTDGSTRCESRDEDHMDESDDVTCGCHAGQEYCRQGARGCFFRGRWFPVGMTIKQRRPECVHRICTEKGWGRAPMPCEASYPLAYVQFQRTSVSDSERSQMNGVGSVLSAPEYDLVLRSVAAPDEGPNRARLATLRASATREYLVSLGYDDKRISIDVFVPKAAEPEPLARFVIVIAKLRSRAPGAGTWVGHE